MTDQDKRSVPAPVFDVGGEDMSPEMGDKLNLIAGGSTECIDRLVEERDTALEALRGLVQVIEQRYNAGDGLISQHLDALDEARELLRERDEMGEP